MAGWRDNLRPASFRGVPFEITDHELGVGRRGPLHEYAGRDKPYFEDLGRKARGISVTAFVIGEDYAAKRDRLIEACEKPGPGTLIHPYLGSMQVACTSASLRERFDNGRIAELSLTFVEAGDLVFPTSQINSAAVVDSRASDLSSAADAAFKKNYSMIGLPGFVPSSVASEVTRLFGQLQQSMQLGDVQSVADKVLLNMDAIVRSPADLSESLQAIVAGAGIGGYQSDLLGLTIFLPDTTGIIQTTTTRQSQVRSLDAFGGLVRALAIAEYGKGISAADYGSFQDAISTAKSFVALIDGEVQSGPAQYDDDLYHALNDMSEGVYSAVSERSQYLTEVTTTSFLDSKPALVLAYNLWADSSRDQEIIDRNNIVHPSFLPPNTDLEVLRE